MRLCPNCMYEDGRYNAVRCQTCGADLLPEEFSNTWRELRDRVAHLDSIHASIIGRISEAQELHDKTANLINTFKQELDRRFTDEAVGRAMRKLGQITDENAKAVAAATDADPDIPF